MKKTHLALFILGGLFMTKNHASELPFKIRTVFEIKRSFCAIKTNGILNYENRHAAWIDRTGDSMSSSSNSLLLLENGENEISLEIGAVNWFSDDPLSLQERQQFKPRAGCKLELMRGDEGNEEDTYTLLASINVHIDENGIPAAISYKPDSSYIDKRKFFSTGHILQKKVTAMQVEPGHINHKYFNDTFFPKDMELYQFTQKVNISGIPVWKWVHATPFNGSNEHLQKLRDAYAELAEIINNKDRARLKKFEKISLEAWTLVTGDSEDDIISSRYIKDNIEGGFATIAPINWDNYSVRVMNKGRLVQLYNKSELTYSPLTFYATDSDGDETMGFYAPIFSLIDGKFVPVI